MEKLAGELWRELLSSEPWHANRAEEETRRTGNPMGYWKGLTAMAPAFNPMEWLNESSTAEARTLTAQYEAARAEWSRLCDLVDEEMLEQFKEPIPA